MPLQLAKASENGDATFSRLTMANIGPHSIVLWAHWCGAMRFGCEFGVDTVWGSASVAHHMLIMHTVTFWRSCCPWIIHVGVLHANIQTIFISIQPQTCRVCVLLFLGWTMLLLDWCAFEAFTTSCTFTMLHLYRHSDL